MMNYVMIFVIGVIIGIILMAIITAANNVQWGCRDENETKNPREGMDFNDYLAEQLKDPEFRKEWENVLKEEENETN